MLADTQQPTKPFKLWSQFQTHWELIFALLAGVFILIGWLLSHYGHSGLSVLAYILAFGIGGFAKAKEGIVDTLEHRKLNVEMLMVIAAVGSALIGYWVEGAILILIFSLSGALETYTMNKSKKEISSLMSLQPEKAVRYEDGMETSIPIDSLRVNDVIIIRAGERVPADGELIDGETTFDEAAITGEAIPVLKSTGDDVFAGTVNIRGTILVKVTKPLSETLFQRIIHMVQTAQSEKSPSQLSIERMEGTYVKVVLLVVALMMVLPHYVLGWSWTETIYRAMILLVVASPCALVASIMPATLSAISSSAKRGILFKGGVHIENLGHLKAVAFDKTGTLTNGTPEVTDVVIRDDLQRDSFFFHVASLETYSNHPLAQAIVAYSEPQLADRITKPEQMEDISGYGVQGLFADGQWKAGSAAFVGEQEAASFQHNVAERLAAEGKTVVFIKDDKGIAGVIALKDTIRPEAVAAIEALRKEGITPVMLTGDSEQTAKAIAAESGLTHYEAACLPEKKVSHIKELQQQFGTVAMVGDGINDAPALATANVGVAMGDGTDVALETADVVLMKNDLPRLAEAVKRSKKMNRIIKQNIVFSLSVVALLIASNFMQVLDLPLGVIGHEGSTILVILNGLRLLKW
ncbi:cadmium-translocating P-type ATPase [Alkalihalobacillus oceani]|uniref:heavy metal translocating P-type ATPase n=1 Tax=Halalkalibacter oceani TaxID=1653776 RepID=UPI00203C437B|nr:heavy metal translocating P-type ATPase [Halalkalibacter oceani]MCM3760738.1 cadmium-translocating P-type ATPase [Halalkalibacter oceani]